MLLDDHPSCPVNFTKQNSPQQPNSFGYSVNTGGWVCLSWLTALISVGLSVGIFQSAPSIIPRSHLQIVLYSLGVSRD